jgi:phage gp46-like protein
MDVFITETLNGGDLLKNGNDVFTVNSFENMPYIALFGGNPLQRTPVQRVDGEQNFDWWGNAFETDTVLQTNSLTERVLRESTLNSAGRISIQNAVNADLEFMRNFANIEVEVRIISDDKVQILISIIEPKNLQRTQLIFIWDSSRQALDGLPDYVPPAEELYYLLQENGFYILQENGSKIII